MATMEMHIHGSGLTESQPLKDRRIEDPVMIDAADLIWVILHKAASKNERVRSVDKKESFAINMFGLINGQAYF